MHCATSFFHGFSCQTSLARETTTRPLLEACSDNENDRQTKTTGRAVSPAEHQAALAGVYDLPVMCVLEKTAVALDEPAHPVSCLASMPKDFAEMLDKRSSFC